MGGRGGEAGGGQSLGGSWPDQSEPAGRAGDVRQPGLFSKT